MYQIVYTNRMKKDAKLMKKRCFLYCCYNFSYFNLSDKWKNYTALCDFVLINYKNSKNTDRKKPGNPSFFL